MTHKLDSRSFYEYLRRAQDASEETVKELAANSYSDYRVSGLDSVCLYKDDNYTVRINFIQANNCNKQGLLMHPRLLNFTTSSVVIRGHVGVLRFVRNGWSNSVPFAETGYDNVHNKPEGHPKASFITYGHEELYARDQCFHITHNEITSLKTDYVFNEERILIGTIESNPVGKIDSKIFIPFVPYKLREVEEFTETKGDSMGSGEYKMSLRTLSVLI